MFLISFLILILFVGAEFNDKLSGILNTKFNNYRPSIINGYPIEKDLFPFMCGLVFEDQIICGASIIHSKWAITAAHCVNFQGTAHIECGRWNQSVTFRKEEGRRITIDNIEVHPLHDDKSNDFDVALLHLGSLVCDYNPITIGTDAFSQIGQNLNVIG